MTESAISTAYANLRESLGDALPICLHVSDMLSYLQAVRGTFDVVVAAFAIHHLTSADKLQAGTPSLCIDIASSGTISCLVRISGPQRTKSRVAVLFFYSY